uniref:Uncharacterized protein n=1 Tax=Ditylenchus dipsaci TaxID=166011 RepID=A0A915EJL9_9BILA
MLASRCIFWRTTFFIHRPLSTTSFNPKGHSKWDNIAGDKSKTDAAKSLKIGAYMKRIKSFVKEGGFDRNVNTKLDALRKQYKADSLPIETFDAHLLKLKNNPDVVVSYNFIGPNNSLFIVEFEAENKSRIQRDVNKHLKKLPDFRLTSNLTETHFEEKGVIVIKAKTKESVPLKLEQLEEVGIELECEDVQIITGDHPNDSSFELICAKAHVNKIETELDKRGYQVISAEVQARPFESKLFWILKYLEVQSST